jgi:hypothetical protein
MSEAFPEPVELSDEELATVLQTVARHAAPLAAPYIAEGADRLFRGSMLTAGERQLAAVLRGISRVRGDAG